MDAFWPREAERGRRCFANCLVAHGGKDSLERLVVIGEGTSKSVKSSDHFAQGIDRYFWVKDAFLQKIAESTDAFVGEAIELSFAKSFSKMELRIT